jgi:glycosyltransferase involved in cell wall biosynthesis
MSARPDQTRPILHIALGKTFRGGERQALWLHEGLLSRNQRSILACRQSSELAQRTPPHAIPFSWRGPADLSGLIRFINLCRRVRPAILHCHDSHAFTLGSIAGWQLKIPVVVTRRVLFAIKPTALNRRKYRRSRQIIAISSAVAELCRPLAGNTPLVIVPDGVTWEKTDQSRLDIRKKLGVTDDTFLLATVGHFSSEKNLPLIFKLCRHLSNAAPASRILCIGPMDHDALHQAQGLSNLIALGQVAQAADLYPAFDGYVSTSLSEGLGSALLDAVVRDIPAVAINAGGTADIFPQDFPGLIDPSRPDDLMPAVETLISQPEIARQQAVAAGKRARGIFSVERMVTENLRIYQKILGDSSASALPEV